MKARTTTTALALLAVAAPAANARPIAHLAQTAHVSHANIPWDTNVTTPAVTRLLYRCVINRDGHPMRVWLHSKCDHQPGGKR